MGKPKQNKAQAKPKVMTAAETSFIKNVPLANPHPATVLIHPSSSPTGFAGENAKENQILLIDMPMDIRIDCADRHHFLIAGV